jgi:hypothetical protein
LKESGWEFSEGWAGAFGSVLLKALMAQQEKTKK